MSHVATCGSVGSLNQAQHFVYETVNNWSVDGISGCTDDKIETAGSHAGGGQAVDAPSSALNSWLWKTVMTRSRDCCSCRSCSRRAVLSEPWFLWPSLERYCCSNSRARWASARHNRPHRTLYLHLNSGHLIGRCFYPQRLYDEYICRKRYFTAVPVGTLSDYI